MRLARRVGGLIGLSLGLVAHIEGLAGETEPHGREELAVLGRALQPDGHMHPLFVMEREQRVGEPLSDGHVIARRRIPEPGFIRCPGPIRGGTRHGLGLDRLARPEPYQGSASADAGGRSAGRKLDGPKGPDRELPGLIGEDQGIGRGGEVDISLAAQRRPTHHDVAEERGDPRAVESTPFAPECGAHGPGERRGERKRERPALAATIVGSPIAKHQRIAGLDLIERHDVTSTLCVATESAPPPLAWSLADAMRWAT